MFSERFNRPGLRIVAAVIGLFLVTATMVGATTIGPYAYVANVNDNNVSRINPADWTVDQTIAVGGMPLGVAAGPLGRYVYVVNAGDNSVSRINVARGAVDDTINVGTRPNCAVVSPDGGTVWVTNNVDDTVSKIDVASWTVTATIDVGDAPVGIDIRPAGDRVYVVNEDGNTVSVIDTAADAVIKTINVQTSPFGVAVDPDGSFAYVTNRDSNTVSKINLSTNSVVSHIVVGSEPNGAAVTGDGVYVYVANGGSGNVSRIVTATAMVDQTIDVGISPAGVAMDPVNGYAAVTNDATDNVSWINIATGQVDRTINVGSLPESLGKFIVYYNSESDSGDDSDRPAGGPDDRLGGGGDGPPPLNPGGRTTTVAPSPMTGFSQARTLPLACWDPSGATGAAKAIKPAGLLPGLMYQLTGPEGYISQAFLPLAGAGTTPQGVQWTTAIRDNYDVRVVDLELTWPPGFTALVSPGRWTATYWLQTEAGACSNKRWEYFDIGLGTSSPADRPAATADRELTFNLLLSVFSPSAFQTSRVQAGLIQVFSDNQAYDNQYINNGLASIRLPFGQTSEIYIGSTEFENARTLACVFQDGMLLITDQDNRDKPVVYYQDPVSGGYCLEYYRNSLYICNPADEDGPIAGLLYGN